MDPKPLLTCGWREWVGLPDLAIGRLKAKVDSGARSSAFHVNQSQRTVHDGAPWVRFALQLRRHEPTLLWAEAPLIDEREVTDSGGHKTLRPFVRTRLMAAGQIWPIDINLTSRAHMLFPMLLGRTALAGRVLIDPSRSYLWGGNEHDPSDFDHRQKPS